MAMFRMQEYIEGRDGCCVSCGFLAKFILGEGVPPPKFEELTVLERDRGIFEITGPQAVRENIPLPACFRQHINIQEEFGDIYQNYSDSIGEIYKIVFNKERNCPKWMKYTPGFSPMEHLQEFKMLELEQRREEFEQKMANERKAFDLKIDESNKKFQELLERDNRSFQWWLTLLLMAFALLEVGAALIQVGFPDGWPWAMNWFGNGPQPPIDPYVPGGY